MSLLVLFLSVIVGIVIVFAFNPSKKITQLLLSFSGAYLLAITITHLLPEVFSSSINNIGLFIILGLLVQLIMDYFSKGAEHGHIHAHGNNLPVILFVSLCLHAFIEGIPVHDHNHEELLWAIVIHKIPITIVLGSFLVYAKTSIAKSLAILILFALMSPLGSLAGEHIPLLINYKAQITAIIVGIFLHISTIIIFESSENHKFNRAKFIAIVVGFAVAALI
ncbi:ZIP family metal transporter [Urechidicola vernalis]|uniref:ZIP family metal transporter n=1 Tax=Urechidicola vernalis TaxID=3075600 RepID=A0ABU2Y213_9FLAO|nr:ZIP family metal transporter [Urechidicola sp. P050]MDT0552246.1 ZIP family metal transporter [Urechidicola sp. P050]